MNKTRFVPTILLLTAALASFTSCSSTQSNTREKFVEQASFESLQGETVNISDFEGKVILIDFWETWCRPCLESFPTMQQLMDDYPDQFVVLAVTPGFADTREDARRFISKHDYDFVFLFDTFKLSEKLGIQQLPYKVFVDAEGEYIKSEFGSYGPEGDYQKVRQIIEEHQDPG